MAKSSKKQSLAVNILLVVVAVLVGVVAYKQIYLAGQLSASLQEEPLTEALEHCFASHAQPAMFREEFAKLGLNSEELGKLGLNSAATGLDWKGLWGSLGGLFGGVSQKVVTVEIQKNYLTEIKVLKIQGFTPHTGKMRVTGTVEMKYQVPVVGGKDATKDYRTVVFKRGEEMYFNELDVKKPDSAQWDQWQCAQPL